MKGHFVDDFVTDDALDEFSRLSRELVRNAIGNADVDEPLARLTERNPFKAIVGETRVELKRARFPSERGFELVLELTRHADDLGNNEN